MDRRRNFSLIAGAPIDYDDPTVRTQMGYQCVLHLRLDYGCTPWGHSKGCLDQIPACSLMSIIWRKHKDELERVTAINGCPQLPFQAFGPACYQDNAQRLV